MAISSDEAFRDLLENDLSRDGLASLTVTRALRTARVAADAIGGTAPGRLAAGHTLLVGAAAFVTATSIAAVVTAGAFASPVYAVAALVVTLAGTLVAVSTTAPGWVVLHSSLRILGGIGRVPVQAAVQHRRLARQARSYAARRLTAAQLDTFRVLAPEYDGTVRELVTVSQSLT